MSRTGTLNPVGAFSSFGSCDSERCVFAMQIGRRSSPSRVNSSTFARAAGSRSAPYAFTAIASIFSGMLCSSE